MFRSNETLTLQCVSEAKREKEMNTPTIVVTRTYVHPNRRVARAATPSWRVARMATLTIVPPSTG
jgi:hypothetical protein